MGSAGKATRVLGEERGRERQNTPDLKVHVRLIGCEAWGPQARHTDTLFQEAAGWRHKAGQRQGDA